MLTPKPGTDKKRAYAKPRRARDMENQAAKPIAVSSSSMLRPGLPWSMMPGFALIVAAVIVYGVAVKPRPAFTPMQAQLPVRAASPVASRPAPPPFRQIQNPAVVKSPPAQAAAKPQAPASAPSLCQDATAGKTSAACGAGRAVADDAPAVAPRELRPSPEQVSSFVQDMGDKAAMLVAGYGRSEAGQSRNEFRDLIRRDFDLERIGHFAFGPAWERATSAQQQEYQKLFAAWTVGNYARLLESNLGRKFTVLGAAPVAGDGTMVRTRIEWPGLGSADFGLLVSDAKGRMRITDVVIENDVSVDLLQREDFASVIRRHGIDGLIGDLRQRVNADEAEKRAAFAERDPGLAGPAGLGR